MSACMFTPSSKRTLNIVDYYALADVDDFYVWKRRLFYRFVCPFMLFDAQPVVLNCAIGIPTLVLWKSSMNKEQI